MTTFKKLAGCVSAFNRDEKGASGSIEQVGGVAVAVIILAAVLKMTTGSGGLLDLVKEKMTSLIGDNYTAGTN